MSIKYIEIKDKSREELSHLLADLRSKLLKLNFDLADNKVKDVSQVKKIKKDISRALTAINSQNK